ncbi:hypothetical protein ABIB48_001404 [Arthrobacter sp. UYCu511]|uniref:hypothetical protein n=1 Tax=Arthrobacter sp. UYCu511 TaxID=3156337 RepID=UPI003393845C
MSGPQPWPGPNGKPSGSNVPPPPNVPPAGSPSGPFAGPPAGPPSGESKGKGKIAAWIAAGTVLLGAIIVGAVFAVNTLLGVPAQPPLAGTAGQNQGASPNSSSQMQDATGEQDSAPQQGQPESQSAPQRLNTVDNSGYSNADKAYCKWQGKVVFVGASDSFRAAICEINGETTYLGLDKKSGSTIVLPASRTSNSAQARNGNYSYALNASTFTISANNDVIAEEKMLSWWTPSAPELKLPGDLGLSQPISYPACDGTGVIVLATAFEPATNAATIEQALRANPGSMYLRTDLSCDNFRGPSKANSNGNSIYAVIKAVPGSKSDVCAAMKAYDATGEWLENNVDPATNVTCS